MTQAQTFYRQGNLHAAQMHLASFLRENFNNTKARAHLLELLCIQTSFEQALQQLQILLQQLPQKTQRLKLISNLIQAASARSDYFLHGRLPIQLSQPNPSIKLLLKAGIEQRLGHSQAAAALGKKNDEKYLIKNTKVNHKNCYLFRDMDDLVANILEIFSTQWEYCWLAFSAIKQIKIQKPKTLLDIIWRPTEISYAEKNNIFCYLPSTYFFTDKSYQLNLMAESTTWKALSKNLFLDNGLKMFLSDNTAISFNEIEEICGD